jgi:hypothetical protein
MMHRYAYIEKRNVIAVKLIEKAAGYPPDAMTAERPS